MSDTTSKSRVFLVTREAFSDYFNVHLVNPVTGLPNGQTEELDIEEVTAWFRSRGANVPMLEKSLDHIYNFYKGAIEISNYHEPPVKNTAIRPQID